MLTDLKNDDLLPFAQSICLSKKTFPEHKIIDETALPIHFDPTDTTLYSTMSTRTFNLDSLAYSTNNNAYVSFKHADQKEYGEIVFFQKSEISTCLLNVFRIVKCVSHKDSSKETDFLSFVEVEYAGYQKEIFTSDICNKLLRIDLDNRIFMSVIVDHFEHNYS